MKSRHLLFSGIFVLMLLCFTEVLLRIGLVFFGYSFVQPSGYIFTGFYDNLKEVQAKEIQRGGEVKNVLILGGSVVSTPWSHLESRLDTLLQKHYGGKARYAFYNIAGAGHTSRDNALKYSLLANQRFDLVIYYEAINENRANNVPSRDFRKDYSHIRWYRDIDLLQSHPEINTTVLPFLLDKLVSVVRDRLSKRIFISQEKVDPQYSHFGADIKTAECYRANIAKIIQTARHRGDKLLLVNYASYFPENVTLTGEEKDMQHFAGCHYASPVTIWGRPENVKKGISVHNAALRALAKQHNTLFLDMEARLPKSRELFCDVCHVSEPGAQRFANEIVEFIIRYKILE